MTAGTHRMKKVEIVIETVKLPAVLAIIDRVGAGGYTIFPSVTGRGHRGRRAGIALTNVFHNSMVFTLVDESTAETIRREVNLLIQDYAGVIIVTDADVTWPDYARDQTGRSDPRA